MITAWLVERLLNVSAVKMTVIFLAIFAFNQRLNFLDFPQLAF